jgi:hypothetical protein
MTLGQLPEELLQLVIWSLKLDVYSCAPAKDKLVTRKTLLSCTLANSTLHRLAEPVLYHSISQRELTRLVQCCVRRPKLVNLVRELRDCEPDAHGPLTEGLQDVDDWRGDNIEICELWNRPYEMPAVGFVLLMCTRLETLVLEKNACDLTFPPGDVLAECTALYEKSSAKSGTPLAALRTLVMQPGPDYQFRMNEYDEKWFPGVVSLPNIETIEIAELGMYDFDVSPSISSLKSLTIGSSTMVSFGYTGGMALSLVLEDLLAKCPSLQYLDVTFQSGPNQGDDCLDSLGSMLSNHGSSLRTLHIYDPYEMVMPAQDGAPISLVTMENLRTLTLPGNAMLPSQCNRRGTSDSLPEHQIDGSDRENANSQLNGTSQDDERHLALMNGPEEIIDPASVPLKDILPPNLTQLAIVENTTLASNVAKLDWVLGEVLLSLHFRHLETIRVWRDPALTKQMMDIDWDVETGDGWWKVYRRL